MQFWLLRARLSGWLCFVKADFFLTSILVDLSRSGHALIYGFLNPFIDLILILKESVTAKDIPTCKGYWGHVEQACSHRWIVCLSCAPPGSF